MSPVRNVATGLATNEMRLLREAIERHAPDLGYLLTDTTHSLSLEEADRLVDAVAMELSVGEDGALDERGLAFDSLIGRVNLGPQLR